MTNLIQRTDLLWHYIAGQSMQTFFDLVGLTPTQNAQASAAIAVGKELLDSSFDWLDLTFTVGGWVTAW